MPQVQMPDGTIVEMPDKVDPTLAARLQAFQKQGPVAKPKAEEGGFVDGLVSTAKNVGSGLVRGVMGLPNLLGELTDSAMDANPEIQAKRARLRAEGHKVLTGADKAQMNRDFDAKLYQPKSTGEKYVQAAAQGVGGALSTGPATLTGVAAGVGSGLGSEGAAQAFGEGPVQRIVGGLLGGIGTGMAASRMGNKAKMAQEALQGVTPEELAVAQENMRLMKSQGVAGNLSQAMPRPSNIDTLVDTLANNRYGVKVQSQLRAQPQQVQIGLETEMAKLPGDIRAPQDVANNVQDAATAVIDTAKQARRSAWKQTLDDGIASQRKALEGKASEAQGAAQAARQAFINADAPPLASPFSPERVAQRQLGQAAKQAEVAGASATAELANLGNLSEDAVRASYRNLKSMAAERPNTDTAKMLSGLADDLIGKDGKILTNVEQLNDVLKQHTTKLKPVNMATLGVPAGDSKFLGNVINSLRQEWGEKFQPLRAANQVFARQTEEIVDPLKKSVVGRMAGRRGELPDVEATKSKVMGLFNQGTVPGSTSSDILRLEKALRGVKAGEQGAQVAGSAAYQDSVKTWMADKISSAVQYKGGRLNDDLAEQLRHSFQGNETKAQGFRDMLVGMARSQGLKDDALYPGVERFMKVVGMAARRPRGVQGANSADLNNIAGSSALKGVGNFSMITPIRQPILRWVEYLKGDSYKAMDELLTSPEGIDMLQKLAKQRPGSTAAQKLVATFAATNAAAHPPVDEELSAQNTSE